MIHIYYILLLIISVILTIMYGPQLVALIKRYFTRTKHKPSVDCSVLESRIAILEQKVYKRSMNQRKAMREEIKNILTELKNK